MATRQVRLGEQWVDAQPVDFKEFSETFNEYALSDGTRLRVKTVVTEVYRVEGAFTPDGEPMYIVKHHPVVITQAQDHLRRLPPSGGPNEKEGGA